MMHIALIEDDTEINRFYHRLLSKEGYRVSSFFGSQPFLNELQSNVNSYDLVICDYRIPDQNGFSVYTAARTLGLQCPFLLMSAYGDFDIAVKALKAGVSDYLIKPLNKDILLQKVSSYFQRKSLEEEILFTRLGKRIIAQSDAMQKVLYKLSRAAESKVSILLAGESGAGKEVVARMLHQLSPRSRGTFVAVNVSAVPETLFEAEFFGYRRGAFTDAIRDHEGYARMAHGGTLFLDEIGELSMASQAKLLRLLEEGRVQPLGSRESFPVDFRLMCASNKELKALVKAKQFRLDLYYRITVISVHLPPLRKRTEDLIPLARYLLRQIAGEEQLEILDFTPKAQEKLLAYPWPGNVRELKNRIHEAVLATDEKWIDAHHLNLPTRRKALGKSLAFSAAKAEFEKRYTIKLLRATGGNIRRIAELSELSRKAIYDILRRHEIDLDNYRK